MLRNPPRKKDVLLEKGENCVLVIAGECYNGFGIWNSRLIQCREDGMRRLRL